MSDLLIRGMKMPVFEEQSWDIRKGADGKWYVVDTNAETSDGEWHEILPVPPHGDLVDLKAPFKAQYYDEMTEEWVEKIVTVEDALYGCMVDEMPPTIIPAEEGEA